MGAIIQSRCWNCRRAIGECSWSSEFIPVKGWTAEKTIIKTTPSAIRDGKVDSYLVYDCPLFEHDPPKKSQKQRLRDLVTEYR